MASFLRTPESRFANLPSFPYKPHYVHLPSSKEFRMAYIDQRTSNYSPNRSRIFLCLHGVPTYSYLYRKIIPILLSSNKYHQHGVRVICPDFIGFGRSDKAIHSSIHKFKYHRQTIIELIKYLNLNNNNINMTLIVQDWGGLIGLTLPIAFIKYNINNKLNKINKINNNPIKSILFFNTTIPNGNMTSKAFLNWRKYSQNTKNLNVINLMKMSGLNNLRNEEINGYNAPFINSNYKLAINCWPSNVPIHPDYEGLDIWNKSFMYYQRNKHLNEIKLFMCHGCQDALFSIDAVKSIYKMMINKQTNDDLGIEYGISSETGGVLWVPTGGHFLQENPDIEWMINKSLKYFGDIPYSDVEYEWILSSNHSSSNIIKITLNKSPVNVLSYKLISGLNNIFNKYDNNKLVDGFILTSNISTKKGKLAIFSAGYDFELFIKKDRNLIKKYFYEIAKMNYLLATLHKPIIAALNGSVIAGGSLLALRCDYRIMFNNSFISMNEVRNGIQFKSRETHDFIKRYVASDSAAQYVLSSGKNFYAKDAKDIGLINEYINVNKRKVLFDRCINVLENDYFKADTNAAYIAKMFAKQDIIVPLDKISDKDAEAYADTFLSSKVQSAINKLFNRKKKSKL